MDLSTGSIENEYNVIGQELANRRNELGLSLHYIAEFLKIRMCYLQALEEGRHDEHISSVYIRGYIGNYAEFLGLNKEEIVDKYFKASQGHMKKNNQLQTNFVASDGKIQKDPKRWVIYVSIIGCVLLFLLFNNVMPHAYVDVKKIYGSLFTPTVSEKKTISHDKTELKAFLQKLKDEKQKLVILSKGQSWISIYRNKNLLHEKNLKEGDTYFIPEGEIYTIDASHPEELDLFIEGETSEYVDNIKSILNDSSHPLHFMFN